MVRKLMMVIVKEPIEDKNQNQGDCQGKSIRSGRNWTDLRPSKRPGALKVGDLNWCAGRSRGIGGVNGQSKVKFLRTRRPERGKDKLGVLRYATGTRKIAKGKVRGVRGGQT